jgi:hypothetical protein
VELSKLLEFKPLAQKSRAIKHLAGSPRKGSNPVTHPISLEERLFESQRLAADFIDAPLERATTFQPPAHSSRQTPRTSRRTSARYSFEGTRITPLTTWSAIRDEALKKRLLLRYPRSDLKPTRTSSEKSCGCSQAAKWPPLSTLL